MGRAPRSLPVRLQSPCAAVNLGSCRVVWIRNEAKSSRASQPATSERESHRFRPSGILDAMATAVPATSLPLPRRAASPADAARRPATPPLRKRHCAVGPVSAACSAPPPRQLENGRYPALSPAVLCSITLRAATLPCVCAPDAEDEEGSGRRRVLVAGAAAATTLLSRPNQAAFAAESKKGFLPVIDKKAGYSFLYPFGWQEVAVQGQEKVYKDVIEPLESVSINTIATSKEDIRELGPPDKVAETLIKKVLAPPSQKTKLIEAKENEVDGRTYYTFEFTAQAANYTRHALGAIAIGNGKCYTLTTGANERRWDKMKDRLHTVIDSFRIENRI